MDKHCATFGHHPAEADGFPRQPGCYIFKNKQGEIIYIGKSKCLRNRIKQHISGGGSRRYGRSDRRSRQEARVAGYIDHKHEEMMRALCTIDLLPTETETDALILECCLIKQHKPRYNALLKHDQRYPFIRVDLRQPYPTLSIADTKAKDGCLYYGSFYSYNDAQAALALINGIWRTPLCGKTQFGSIQRPCLQYHFQKCRGPCTGEADAADYSLAVREIVKCLSGHFRTTLARLKREMNAAAADMRFEQAAVLRDQIRGLCRLRKKQQHFCTDLANKECYLFFRAFREERFTLFFIKNGVTLRRADFENLQPPDEAQLASFVHTNAAGGAGTVPEGAFLTGCLLEIGACKYFVPVSPGMREAKIIDRLMRGFQAFGKPKKP